MRQIDSMRAHNTRCIKNIIACVTQSLKTIELDKSVWPRLLTNVKIFLQNDKKIDFWGVRGLSTKWLKNMVKMSFSPSVQKKKWTKSGQNPVIYQGFFDFPGRAIFSLFSWFFHDSHVRNQQLEHLSNSNNSVSDRLVLEFCCEYESCEKVMRDKKWLRRTKCFRFV